MGQGNGRTRDPEYLFDLQRDSGETQNLASDMRLEADRLMASLLEWIDAGRFLETGVPVDDPDDTTRSSLEALGYLD